MTGNYLSILEESLEKKVRILDLIQEYSLRQQELFRSEEVDLEQYDEYVDKKGELIEELEALDEGFETLYQRTSQELENNRAQYAGQIRRLQELVTRITEKSVAIQTQEARNKKLVEEYFQRERANIAQSKKHSQGAYDYYLSMRGAGISQPQFYDSKQ